HSDNPFVLSGGALEITGQAQFDNTFSSSFGVLSAEGVISFAGDVAWKGGGMTGGGVFTVGSASTFTIGPNGPLNFGGGTLNINGTINVVDSGGVFGTSGTTINNYGLFNFTSDGSIIGVTQVNNFGTLSKTGGASGGGISVPLNNN